MKFTWKQGRESIELFCCSSGNRHQRSQQILEFTNEFKGISIVSHYCEGNGLINKRYASELSSFDNLIKISTVHTGGRCNRNGSCFIECSGGYCQVEEDN